MKNICDYLTIKHGTGIADCEEYVVVERCEEVEASLVNYYIVCDRNNLPEICEWVNDNTKNVASYISSVIAGGNYTFAFSLIRGNVHLESYTEVFVTRCGSIQAFLDTYGASEDIIFSDEVDAEEPVDVSTLPEVEQSEPTDDIDDVLSGIASLQNSDEGSGEPEEAMVEPDAVSSDGVSGAVNLSKDSDTRTAFSLDPVDAPPMAPPVEPATSPVEPIASPIEPVEPVAPPVEPVAPVNLTKPDAGATISLDKPEPAEAEPKEFIPIDLSKPAPIEEEPIPEPEPVLEPEPTPISVPEFVPKSESEPEPEPAPVPEASAEFDPNATYNITCDNVDIDALRYENGKVVVPFSHLSSLVSDILKALNQVEEADMKALEILKESDVEDAAELVETYAPSVLKEFFLWYIRKASSDSDLIRVTSVLNDFCKFVSDKKFFNMRNEDLINE